MSQCRSNTPESRLTYDLVCNYASGAARTAAGWYVCLDTLESLLDGHAVSAPTHEPTDRFRELYDSYIPRGVPHGAPIPPVRSPG
jgi:hypothetical protein